jgi:hypothetical protein
MDNHETPNRRDLVFETRRWLMGESYRASLRTPVGLPQCQFFSLKNKLHEGGPPVILK